MPRKTALTLIRRLVAHLVPGAFTLEPLGGGRSVAQVFKLTPLSGPGGRVTQTRGQPVVVKIAAGMQGAKEKSNYDTFVGDALPAECRPDLLAFIRTRTHSGLCYSFVGGPGKPGADTLTDCLQRGDVKSLDFVLRRIIFPMRNTWHSPAMVRAERDIAQRYRDRYFTGPRSTARTEATLQACAVRYFKARQQEGRCIIGKLSFPSPRATLFASGRKRPYRSCIIHGDLNSDNIVITENPPGVAVIDFQKTGRGHVHEDLVALEASIRINYLRDAAQRVSFSEILEQERRIALGRRPHNDPYAASIRHIRDMARRQFGTVEYDANYPFAVAAIGLRLMQATDLSHVARARIAASTLWAAKALAGESIQLPT